MIGVGTVITVAIGVFVVYLLLAAFESESDTFGEVPVPSTSLVELSDGEVDVFYAETVRGDTESLELRPPEDLGYTLLGADGPVKINSRGGDVETADGTATRIIGAAFVPEDGTYELRVTSTGAAGRLAPRLTFGQSPVQAVVTRFEAVVDELNGPTGIAAAAALLLLLLVPRVQRAISRTRS